MEERELATKFNVDRTLSDYLTKCFLNSIFYDAEQVGAKDLIGLFSEKYIFHFELRSPQWGIKPDKHKQILDESKNALTKMKNEGYITVELINGEYISKPTQKLFDEDEVPIGFRKRVVTTLIEIEV